MAKIKAVYFSNKSRRINIVNTEATVVFITIVSGIIFGSFFSMFNQESLKEIQTDFISFLSSVTHKNLFEIFMSIITVGLLYVLICFISGGSLFGCVPIIAFIFYISTGLSAVISFLISTYSLKGLEYIFLIFLPGKIILIFAIIVTAVNCISSSLNIKHIIMKNISAEFNNRLYFKQGAFSIITVIVSALIDSVLLKLFLPLFDFV